MTEARPPIGGASGSGNRSSVERDDHLVGTDHAEVFASQLVGEIGIGMARVEQVRAMLQLRLLLLQLRKIGVALLESAMVAAPGEDPVRPGNRVAREGSDDDQREGRKRRAPDEL